MTRRTRLALEVVILAASTIPAGCSSPPAVAPVTAEEELGPRNTGILDSVVILIRDAATNDGGDNFNVAVENLNAYFRDSRPEEFALSDLTRDFLRSQLTPDAIELIGQRSFAQRDGRHIEDSLLCHAVAARVAGQGDDLTRAGRLFDWVTRHAMLVPPGSLAIPGTGQQAQARPFDVMLRGMATEDGRGWSERGWVFMALCRQIGLDAGLIVYTPTARGAGPAPRSRDLGPLALTDAMGTLAARGNPRPWAVAVLVGGKAYMFDPALGMPIPSADGKGVATLEEAATDPRVLAQLDLPIRDYEPSRRDLAAGPVRVLLESSLGSLSPKMKLLQQDLKGKNQMVLYRDPVEQAEAFQKALGDRCGGVGLWRLPVTVEHSLFNDPNFINATLFPLKLFIKQWPLLSARLMQLRGETTPSIQSYVVLRYAESPMAKDGKTPIPPEVQGVLDIFATYFLALAQMEKGDPDQAKFLFGKLLEMLPEPGPRQPYFVMFRWGAITNLGLLYADSSERAAAAGDRATAAKDRAAAIRCLSQDNPTIQGQGNMIRARALIWKNPFVPPKDTPKLVPPLGPPGGGRAG